MNTTVYTYSLFIALPLMIFFGFYFIFAKTPDKAIFANYLRSRRIMAAALLLLAANYFVHFYFKIRFVDQNAAILMNLSTYFLCYWLFSSALTSLLSPYYLTRKRFIVHLLEWVLFTAISSIVLHLIPDGPVQDAGLILLTLWLVVYGVFLSWRLVKAYRAAVKLFDSTHSDDIGAYIHWLSVYTWWAIIFGVGCSLLTWLPDKYIFIWILSSIPFYIYLYCCYMNYLLFYEQVETALESENVQEEELEHVARPACYAEIGEKIQTWIAAEGYIAPGLTLKELSDTLLTNRTYLSDYINTTYHKSFRAWITELRVSYAKHLMTLHPEKTIADISESCGFLSMSHFMRVFKEAEHCSPAQWRKSSL